jgi:hypothetical protein
VVGRRDGGERKDKQLKQTNHDHFYSEPRLGVFLGYSEYLRNTLDDIYLLWRMLLWLSHSALTPRLFVVPNARTVTRTVTHLRHLQPPTAYYTQVIASYNPHLNYRYTRHYSTQRPQPSFASSSAPAQTTQTQPTSAAPLPNQNDKSSVPAEPMPPLMTRVWTKVKHEASHYWHGTKLLASDIRISSRLLASLLRGKTLTRRERRQVRSILCVTWRVGSGVPCFPRSLG